MNLVGGVIIGVIAGAAMYSATKEIVWLPVGVVIGAVIGGIRTRRGPSKRL